MFRRIMSLSLTQHLHLGQNLQSSRHIRLMHHSSILQLPRKPNKPSPAIASKYKVITDENSVIIENTSDELYNENYIEEYSDEFDGINMKRGLHGVFDIEDLVQLLERESSKNIFVATVPEHINYVDYIVIVSARSTRHILALAEFVKKVFKKKCNKHDVIPKIEGKSSTEWMAMDLGNIALHIFSEKTRNVYDLETLWAVGREYDDQINKKTNAVVDIFENYSKYLKDLKPLA